MFVVFPVTFYFCKRIWYIFIDIFFENVFQKWCFSLLAVVNVYWKTVKNFACIHILLLLFELVYLWYFVSECISIQIFFPRILEFWKKSAQSRYGSLIANFKANQIKRSLRCHVFMIVQQWALRPHWRDGCHILEIFTYFCARCIIPENYIGWIICYYYYCLHRIIH